MKIIFLFAIILLNGSCFAADNENPLIARRTAMPKGNFQTLKKLLPADATHDQWYTVKHPVYSELKFSVRINDSVATKLQEVFGKPFDIPNGCCRSEEYYLVFRCVPMSIKENIMGKKSGVAEQVLAAKNKSIRSSYIQVFDDKGEPAYVKGIQGMARIPEADEDCLLGIVFPKRK